MERSIILKGTGGRMRVYIETNGVQLEKCDECDNHDDHGSDWQMPVGKIAEVRELIALLNEAQKYMEQ